MKTKLDLQWFIEQHSNWEELLSNEPYCFQISRDTVCGRNLILFKYNQIDTQFDKCGKIALEARGIVLDEDTNDVVNYGFNKFFNIGEPNASVLDASSMTSSTKIDGSIIKIRRFPDDQLLISTNGTIDAHNAMVAEQLGCPYKSFGDIVDDVLIKKFGSIDTFKDLLDIHKTYIFEMVSPWTRVVTPFKENYLYLIGCRSLVPETGFTEFHFWECPLKEHFKTPEILDFSSIDKCLEYAQTLDWTNEGFVVMDKDFNRVKVKNASWLAVHHLCENHTMSYRRAVDIARANEIDEVIGYFPEFKDALIEVKDKYVELIKNLENAWKRFNEYSDELTTRKDQAIAIQKEFGKYSGVGFSLLDKKVSSPKEFLDKAPTEHIVKALGYKD